MRSRRGAVALLAAALLVGAMLASATPTAYEPPPLVANPVEHVDTLIGTGSGGKSVGGDQQLPRPLGAVRDGAVLAGHRRQLRGL